MEDSATAIVCRPAGRRRGRGRRGGEGVGEEGKAEEMGEVIEIIRGEVGCEEGKVRKEEGREVVRGT